MPHCVKCRNACALLTRWSDIMEAFELYLKCDTKGCWWGFEIQLDGTIDWGRGERK